MARMNVDILGISKNKIKLDGKKNLGISEIKWTGMGELNSDQHYIYYCRIESLRKKMEYPL